eukprot:scaffold128213_cov31-Tisochrysis_lutea.AAC.1
MRNDRRTRLIGESHGIDGLDFEIGSGSVRLGLGGRRRRWREEEEAATSGRFLPPLTTPPSPCAPNGLL